jgi:transcriptional antiterminator Rof (Rho-off)
VRGQALAALGDDAAARAALESSLEEARARDALYEIACTLDAIVDLDLRAGDLAAAEARERESTELLHRLGVRVEPVPLDLREPQAVGATPGSPDVVTPA